jgi:hypothetical protein
MFAGITLAENLEGLIDKYGLARVLETLGTICCVKAHHRRKNWQYGIDVREWERTGKDIGVIAVKADERGLV